MHKMNSILAYALCIAAMSSVAHLSHAVPLTFGDKGDLAMESAVTDGSSLGYEHEISVVKTFTGPQTITITPPNGCSGNLDIHTNVQLSTASFTLDCPSNSCNTTQRTFTDRNIQKMQYTFPAANGFEDRYAVAINNRQVIKNPTCNGTTYEPQELEFSVADLIYNYSVTIVNATYLTVARQFVSLGSANITLNGALVSSISGISSLPDSIVSQTCSTSTGCIIQANGNDNTNNFGDSKFRFYYNVPTFVFFFSGVADSITNTCPSYVYSQSEIPICDGKVNKLGPCISYDISSTILASGPSGSPSFCPTQSPTRAPTTSLATTVSFSPFVFMFVMIAHLILQM